MNFKAVLVQDEEGGFIVSCPTLPGCHSLGYREKDARENIKEAIEGCMQSLAEERMKTGAPGWVVEVTV